MRYSENNLVAGTAFDNTTYRTVVIGFPFETIKTDKERNSLMRQVLNFFKK
jgi:RNase H-fold protein (predicted Holliday junction resolvase)